MRRGRPGAARRGRLAVDSGRSGFARAGSTRPRRSFAGSCAAIPTTSTRSTTWPGCWAFATRSKTKEALELIDRAIDLQGPVSTLVDTRAVVCIRDGQVDRAVRNLKRAQKVDPRNRSLALHLAWAYHAQGKSDEARQAFQEAEKLGWKPEKSDPLERPFIDSLRQGLSR